jgi:two-component system sensor histidine kinase KdpD
MKNSKEWFREAAFTIITLLLVFFCNIVIQEIYNTQKLTPMIFVLGVFLIALKTKGYFWGITASLLSVLAVNYAFSFPYYAFDLLNPELLFSAIVMLVVAIITGTLTTKIKMQEKIKADTEKERMRSNLLRAVSHDIRTPLTTIYGSSSTIIENFDVLSKEQQLKLLRQMNEDSKWLIRMVENLLLVTKMDSEKDKVSITKLPIVLDELIDTVLVKFQKRCPGQKVTVRIPDEFLIVPMDAMLMEQVLLNLLENAIYHAEGMTELILEVTVEGSWAVFHVKDNGCGIEEDKLSKVFSGYRIEREEPVDGKRSNMGIGLSVCAAIVKAHDSILQVRNTYPGTEFYFSLEMEEEDEQ